MPTLEITADLYLLSVFGKTVRQFPRSHTLLPNIWQKSSYMGFASKGDTFVLRLQSLQQGMLFLPKKSHAILLLLYLISAEKLLMPFGQWVSLQAANRSLQYPSCWSSWTPASLPSSSWPRPPGRRRRPPRTASASDQLPGSPPARGRWRRRRTFHSSRRLFCRGPCRSSPSYANFNGSFHLKYFSKQLHRLWFTNHVQNINFLWIFSTLKYAPAKLSFPPIVFAEHLIAAADCCCVLDSSTLQTDFCISRTPTRTWGHREKKEKSWQLSPFHYICHSPAPLPSPILSLLYRSKQVHSAPPSLPRHAQTVLAERRVFVAQHSTKFSILHRM